MQSTIQTSQGQIFPNGEGESMYYPEGSLASHSVWPDKEKERMITVTSGLKCSGLYGKSGPLEEDLNRARTSFHRGARKHLKEYCAICGTTQNLQVHHLDRNIKNNTEENLQTLCQSCHMKLHWQQRRLLKNAKKHHLGPGKNP